jgi:hypothetical protein
MLAQLGETADSEAVKRGIDYLERVQLADGALPLCWTAAAPRCELEVTVWTGSMVGVALQGIEDARARRIVARVREQLESEREPGGLWRWWARNDPRHQAVPTDLDDTACAQFTLGRGSTEHLAALDRYRAKDGRFLTWTDPALLDAPARLAIEKRLAAGFGERTDAGNDIDSGVNLNVLRYAASLGVELPSVCRWLGDQLAAGTVARSSVYYLEPAHLYYLAAHAWLAGAACLEGDLRAASPALVRTLSEQPRPPAASVAATTVFTLLRLGVDEPAIDDAVRALLAGQDPDGSWPPTPSIARAHGSRALDTGLVVEALAAYEKRRQGGLPASAPSGE